MKIAGWICLVLGGLSFIGAASQGDSVFGPCFWIALGAFLLYKVYNKDETRSTQIHQEEKLQVEVKAESVNNIDVQAYQHENPESLDDIQSQLTLQQREASVCMVAFFGGYNDDFTDDTAIVIIHRAATFFGIPDSPSVMSQIMPKYTNADMLIDIIQNIKSRKAIEFLLLTCYDLTKASGKEEPYEILLNFANDMGYDKTRFAQLVNQYK